jgi:hypothetical protein
MRSSRRGTTGATLIEVMIMSEVGFGILGLGVYGVRMAMSGDEVKRDAEAEVRSYAADLKLPVDGISCGNITNRKGLVGYTLRSGDQTKQLECIGRYSPGHGCRDQKLSTPGQLNGISDD